MVGVQSWLSNFAVETVQMCQPSLCLRVLSAWGTCRRVRASLGSVAASEVEPAPARDIVTTFWCVVAAPAVEVSERMQFQPRRGIHNP